VIAQLELDEADRQLVLLALAILSLDRPGWFDACRVFAEKLGPGAPIVLADFRRLNADRWHEQPPAPLVGPRPR